MVAAELILPAAQVRPLCGLAKFGVRLLSAPAAEEVAGWAPRARCRPFHPAPKACSGSDPGLSPCIHPSPSPSVPHPAGPRLLVPAVGRAGRLLVEPRCAAISAVLWCNAAPVLAVVWRANAPVPNGLCSPRHAACADHSMLAVLTAAS